MNNNNNNTNTNTNKNKNNNNSNSNSNSNNSNSNNNSNNNTNKNKNKNNNTTNKNKNKNNNKQNNSYVLLAPVPKLQHEGRPMEAQIASQSHHIFQTANVPGCHTQGAFPLSRACSKMMGNVSYMVDSSIDMFRYV